MNVAGYHEKVPESVQEENQSKATKLTAELQTIEEIAANFQSLLV